MNFDEPYWWTVSGNDADVLLDGITKILTGVITRDEFFIRHPPKNKPKNNLIDMEGFVFLRQIGESEYSYSKLKTEIYYIGHKFHMFNLSRIEMIPSCIDESFPMIHVVRETFFDIEERLWKCIESCKTLIENFIESNDDVKTRFMNVDPEMSRDKKAKMFVLNSFFKDDPIVWNKVLSFIQTTIFAVFNDTFPLLSLKTEHMWGVKKLLHGFKFKGFVTFIIDNSLIEHDTFISKMKSEKSTNEGIMLSISAIIKK
jgi:hypothetical protein